MSTAKKPKHPFQVTVFDKLPDSAWVRKHTVMALFGVSDTTVWRWSKEGRLPKPTQIGPRTTAWKVGELRKFLGPTS